MIDGYQSNQTPNDAAGQFNAIQFIARQLLNKCSVAALVEVKACTNSGGVAAVGFVDVQPLVNQTDGYGNAIEHGTIYKLPYFRLQGGENAVIIDPQVGDIGIAVFSDVDISKVKETKKRANPGSRRRFDMADGMYFGGMLNGIPSVYVRVTSAGIDIHGPAVNLGNGGTLQKLLTEAFETWASTHTHTSAAPGSPTSVPTQALPANGKTTITKAE